MRLPTAPSPALRLVERVVPTHRRLPASFLAFDYLPEGPHPIARHGLLLPRTSPVAFDMAGLGVEPLATPWVRSPTRGLWVRVATAEEDATVRTLSASLVATPSVVFPALSTEAVTRVAWWALTRFDPRDVARAALTLALLWEHRFVTIGDGPGLDARAVDGLRLPLRARDRMRGQVGSGDVVFDPRCLRWAAAEAAAASAAGRWHVADDTEVDGDDDALRRVFFQQLAAGQPGRPDDIVRALWLLHDGFLAEPESEAFDALAVTALLGFHGVYRPFRWVDTLDHARRLWSVDRSHPSLRRAHPTPDDLAGHVARRLGLPPEQWLGGVFLVAAAYGQRVLRGGPLVLTTPDTETGELGTMRPSFWSAFRSELVVNFDDLGARILAASPAYAGLGSLKEANLVELRHRPVVDIGGALFVGGLDGLALAATEALRRTAQDGPGHANSTLGHMLEAAVVERVRELGGRHRVVGPEVIDAVVPKDGSRCDAIVVDGDHWLLVEVGSQRPRPAELLGRRRALDNRCRHYHEKLDQAEATRPHLGAIAAAAGLPPPRQVTTMIVAAETIMATNALLAELRRARPERQPRFVVSFAELDTLVGLGGRLSVPGLVATWQLLEELPSLDLHLAHFGRIFGRGADGGGLDRDATWRPLVPRRASDAA